MDSRYRQPLRNPARFLERYSEIPLPGHYRLWLDFDRHHHMLWSPTVNHQHPPMNPRLITGYSTPPEALFPSYSQLRPLHRMRRQPALRLSPGGPAFSIFHLPFSICLPDCPVTGSPNQSGGRASLLFCLAFAPRPEIPVSAHSWSRTRAQPWKRQPGFWPIKTAFSI